MYYISNRITDREVRDWAQVSVCNPPSVEFEGWNWEDNNYVDRNRRELYR